MEVLEYLGVTVVNPAEAAKFSLRPIPVAIVIAILRGELAAGDRIDNLDWGHHLHLDRQRRLPVGFAPLLVFKVEQNTRGVSATRHAPHVVFHFLPQLWFHSSGA